MRRDVLGEDNAWTHSSYVLVGEIYRLQGRPEEAEPLHRIGIAGARQSIGPRHWFMGTMLGKYGACLTDLERYDEAEQMLLEGYAILTEAHDAPLVHRQRLARYFVRLYEALDDPEKADAWRAMTESESKAADSADPATE